MKVRRKFISGKEYDDQRKVWRIACTVWDGDDKDPPGMKDLGTEIVEVNASLGATQFVAAVEAAWNIVLGKQPSSIDQLVEKINHDSG